MNQISWRLRKREVSDLRGLAMGVDVSGNLLGLTSGVGCFGRLTRVCSESGYRGRCTPACSRLGCRLDCHGVLARHVRDPVDARDKDLFYVNRVAGSVGNG